MSKKVFQSFRINEFKSINFCLFWNVFTFLSSLIVAYICVQHTSSYIYIYIYIYICLDVVQTMHQTVVHCTIGPFLQSQNKQEKLVELG